MQCIHMLYIYKSLQIQYLYPDKAIPLMNSVLGNFSKHPSTVPNASCHSLVRILAPPLKFGYWPYCLSCVFLPCSFNVKSKCPSEVRFLSFLSPRLPQSSGTFPSPMLPQWALNFSILIHFTRERICSSSYTHQQSCEQDRTMGALLQHTDIYSMSLFYIMILKCYSLNSGYLCTQSAVQKR